MSPSGSGGNATSFPRGLFVNLDLRARVLVRGDDAIFPVPREVHVGNVPGRFLDHVALARREIVARDVFEFAAFVREEVEKLRIRIEGLRGVVHVALCAA